MDYDAELLFPHNKTGRDSNIRNLVRQGKVIERKVDRTQVSVRVQWLDKDGLISRPLPVKQFGSRGTTAFYCPKIGDDVSVTMLPNSDGGEGFVDGSFYNVGNPPPITDPDTRHITFADGTIIEYAEATTARSSGQLRIKSGNPINIQCSEVVVAASNITLVGDVSIEGKLDVSGEISAKGNIRTVATLYDRRGADHN